MSVHVKGRSPANISEATRACLYAVVDRFNTDEPFWGEFIPVADLTEIGEDSFCVAFHGRDLRLTVRGSLIRGIGEIAQIVPSIVVGLWALLVLSPVFAGHVEPTLASVPGLHWLFGGPALGPSILLAAVVLAIMTLPAT